MSGAARPRRRVTEWRRKKSRHTSAAAALNHIRQVSAHADRIASTLVLVEDADDWVWAVPGEAVPPSQVTGRRRPPLGWYRRYCRGFGYAWHVVTRHEVNEGEHFVTTPCTVRREAVRGSPDLEPAQGDGRVCEVCLGYVERTPRMEAR